MKREAWRNKASSLAVASPLDGGKNQFATNLQNSGYFTKHTKDTQRPVLILDTRKKLTRRRRITFEAASGAVQVIRTWMFISDILFD
jgi:hypothetical protein